MYGCLIKLDVRRGLMRRVLKNLVDKKLLGSPVGERESILATLEILFDQDLTSRLLTLSKSIDKDCAAGRLLTTTHVFGR